MRYICIALLKVYKATLSFFIGRNCIYTPTCSVYAMEAYYHHGFFVGTWLTFLRVLRCAPWSKRNRIDYVPYNKKGDIKWSL